MQYMLAVYENTAEWGRLPDAEKRKISDRCWGWHEALLKSGHARMALGLHPPSQAVSVRDAGGAAVVSDGPFAETKEVLGGFELVECKDRDEAVAIARTFPGLAAGFRVEVRPVMTDAEESRRWRAP